MTPEALAQIAYEAWHRPGGYKKFCQWDELSGIEQDAWIAAAQAVKANVLSGFTKVGEGESNQP